MTYRHEIKMEVVLDGQSVAITLDADAVRDALDEGEGSAILTRLETVVAPAATFSLCDACGAPVGIGDECDHAGYELN